MSAKTPDLWQQGLVSPLIRRAARACPPELSARLEEEWLAELAVQTSLMQRWQLALGCCWAALKIRHEPLLAQAFEPEVIPSPIGAAIMSAYAHRGASRMPPNGTRGALASITPVICDINTTPLIDVLLVLLVTLIVTLPVVTHAVKLDLPNGPPPAQVPPVLNLDIDFDGTVVWNGTPVAFEKLDGYFNAEAHKVPQAQVQLRADRRARYGAVAQVLAAAQRNGMQRIGFIDTAGFQDD